MGEAHVGRRPLRGYPAWIRTKNNASKGRCVTITPRGSLIADCRMWSAALQAARLCDLLAAAQFGQLAPDLALALG